MCGIAGILWRGGAPGDQRESIARMTSALEHRGPDEYGYHIDAQTALGHRRLSIIDLATGQQPLYNEDRTVCVVFNGEIYNFAEVRDRLLADGHVFRTHSDTETIVHAYEQWGDSCVEQFRGMFAFAIRDLRNNRLFLARDRFGKKPLFYAEYAGKFVFASEMKAILADGTFDRVIDEEALAAYFTFSYIPAPLTIFRGIRKLLPAHTLSVDERGIREHQYWDLTFAPNYGRSEQDFADEFKARMAESVRMRLISEVPLGAFLSGGIDSSAVVAFMAEASETPVNTFTMGFTGSTGSFDDERKYARLVAERYRTRHFEHEVTPDVASIIEALVRSFDEPFADDSMMPSYFVCKTARERVTVALSGLGGDEAFCGYERYAGFQMGQWFTKLPESMRSRVIGPLVDRVPESSSGSPGVNRLKRFVRAAVDDDGRRYLGLVSKTGTAYRARLFAANARGVARSMEAVESRFLAHFRDAKAEEPLDRVFYCDVKTYLPDDILALTDRLSMCHSLEVRVPFLDHPLFEFAATIPSSVKMRWLRKKRFLKNALRDVLPNAVLTHKKQGFVGPTSQWLRNELKSYTLEMLSPANLAKHGQFDEQTVHRILADHFEGRETNDVLIWALLVFQVWFQLYVEQASLAAPAAGGPSIHRAAAAPVLLARP